MRLISTPETVRKGEISALAIAETLVAMAVSVFIAIKVGTIKHVAVSACIAPFLLLRTGQATTLVLAWGKKVRDITANILGNIVPDPEQFLNSLSKMIITQIFTMMMTFGICIIAITMFAIRPLSILVCSVRHPWASLAAVPSNWRRTVLSTDTAYPSEMLPGIEIIELDEDMEDFRFSKFISDTVAMRDWKFGFITPFIIIPGVVLLYLPSIIYRLSLKSTALIWSPLFWIVRPAGDNLATGLREIRRAAFYKVMRYYSLVVAALFLVKLYILWSWHELVTAWPFWPEIAAVWATLPKVEVLNAYIVPPEIPPWQLAAAINAVLAWAAFWIADLLLVRYGENHPLPEEPLTQAFRGLAIVRNILALYTALCTLYITVTLAIEGKWDLPPLGTKVFPWS